MKTYTLTATKEQLDTIAGFVNEVLKTAGIAASPQAALVLAALDTAKEVEAEVTTPAPASSPEGANAVV